MEIAYLVLEYFKALIWPIVVMTVVLMFRNQLSTILSRLRKADLPMGVSLDFQQELEEGKNLSRQVKQQVEQTTRHEVRPVIPMTEANARLIKLGLQPSPSGLDMEYYRNLAAQDPNLALSGLRLEIDILAKNLARGFQIEIGSSDTGAGLLRKLRDLGAITTEQLELTLKVLQLCNAAVHGEIVSYEQADEIINLTNALREQYLRWLSWGFDDDWHPTESE
jgi:hypothetical protein